MRKLIIAVAAIISGVSASAQVLTPEQLNERPEIRKTLYKDTFLDYDPNLAVDSQRFHQQRTFINYPPIREADVLWSKVIWRDIEVGEKINLPLYYPIEPIEDRKPLFDIIVNAYKEGLIQPFEGVSAAFSGEFTEALTKEKADKAFGYVNQLTYQDSLGQDRDTTYVVSYSAEDVLAYRLKEYWYFDKQRSMLMVKIIGILPICKREMPSGDVIRQATAWFYFPELRPVIANEEVYNRKNETVRITFDDVFIKRYFSSHIVKEDNVYDRTLEQAGYKGYDQLVEADRIKEKIFNFEHDLWDY